MATVEPEGLVNEKSKNPIGNRIRDLPPFSAVPQPTALPNTRISRERDKGIPIKYIFHRNPHEIAKPTGSMRRVNSS